MRIAIVSPMVVGYGMTPEIYSSQQINLAVRWAEAGHPVDLLTMRGQGLDGLADGIRLHECPGVFLGRSGLPLMTGVGAALRDGAHDLVLASEHYQPATAQACLHSQRVLIYQGQNAAGASLKSRVFLRTMDWTVGRITRDRCMGVVAKTGEAARFLAARGYAPIEVIPCGYDERRFYLPSAEDRARCRASLGVDEDEHVFVYVGNLLPRRDVATAIRALALLKGRGKRLRFLIVGQGPEQEALQHLASSLDVAEETVFLGLLPWSRVRDVYWGGDTFVFTAQYEIYGLVLPEAMACGLLVASTPVGAGKEIVTHGETGLVLPVGDPEGVAAVLQRALEHPAWQRHLKEEATRRVLGYTWRAVAQRILDVAASMPSQI